MKNVVVISYDGAQALDIVGPMEVFAQANIFNKQDAYAVACVGVTRGVVTYNNGLQTSPRYFEDWRGSIDTLIVTGGTEAALLALQKDKNFLAWFLRRANKARRVVSVCTGAFVLAELGLLKGRRATTHWNASDRLQKMYPSARVDADVLYTMDDGIYTSAGISAGIDLSLALVEEDLGRDVCSMIARNMVLFLRRGGAQSQFSVPLQTQVNSSPRLEAIVSYIVENPQSDLSVDALSDQFGLSTRQLSRVFVKELGTTPAAYVLDNRLDYVRTHLSETNLSLKQVASAAGFQSYDAMVRAFSRRFKTTPTHYRANFQTL